MNMIKSERHFCWTCMAIYHTCNGLIAFVRFLQRQMIRHCFYDIEY